jgi:hypothetical protein
MTMRIAPMATGARGVFVKIVAPTVRTRKKVPMNSVM